MSDALGIAVASVHAAAGVAAASVHAPAFTAEALIGGEPMGAGAGVSKREAESAAAQAALDKLAG